MPLASSLIHQSVSQSVRSGAAGSWRQSHISSESAGEKKKKEEKKVCDVVYLRILAEKATNT